jgi:hypothetical protein
VLTVHPSDVASVQLLGALAGRSGPPFTARRHPSEEPGCLLEACAPDLSVLARVDLPQSELRVGACALPVGAVLAAAAAAKRDGAPRATAGWHAPPWTALPDALAAGGDGPGLDLGAPELGCLGLVARACGGDSAPEPAARGAWVWAGAALAMDGGSVLARARTPWAPDPAAGGTCAWLPAAILPLLRAAGAPATAVPGPDGAWATLRAPGLAAAWRVPAGAARPPVPELVAHAVEPPGAASGEVAAAVQAAALAKLGRAPVFLGGGAAWFGAGLGLREGAPVPAAEVLVEVPGALLAAAVRSDPPRSVLVGSGLVVLRGERATFALAALPPGAPA